MKKVEIVFNSSFSVFSNLIAPNAFLVVFILGKQKTGLENDNERALTLLDSPNLILGQLKVARISATKALCSFLSGLCLFLGFGLGFLCKPK